ncbi:EcsC family protein [Clostridium beijerinckii]|uniref:EcsC family protein n=1 Tax=Clostridium beijerinckii TaxID=1520 RepID=UPI00098BD6AD|nr:EcsC family protein [Clostridium beijerinckii]NRT80949.1 hypothetical protein [Clostridium beijerinckii]OOM48257.1 EcsC protein family protein [Clostridium beijerinckii]
MDDNGQFKVPIPIINKKETESLEALTERYNKLIKPNKIAQFGAKAGQLLPEKEMYIQMINIIGSGFKTVEEQAARFSISEKNVLSKVNQYATNCEITQLDEICLVRSYDLAKLVSKYKSQDIFVAAIEGGGTGAFGFLGLPFNIVLSTFLYFRAVQSIAMFYGYDVKNDSSELVVASEVFTNALSPVKNDVNNEATSIIGKIMLMSQAAIVKQTAKKTWTDMAARGGVPLLLAQMRALANKAAQKALQNVGAKGLENSLFKEAFEQIGRQLTLKMIGKAVPVVSAVIGSLIDTVQMKKVLEYADIFYQKRFILEKEIRINSLIGENDIIVDAEIIKDDIVNAESMEEK